jgi:hypothetical protein
VRSGFVAAIVTALAVPAAADPNDLVLGHLSTPVMDASGKQIGAIGQNLEFRELSSALGVVLAPHLLTPADTLGFGGFQFSVDYATTTVDQNGGYWRALQGGAPSLMRTVGFFVRKGMWFPVPSIEFGGGAIHLVDSHTWAANMYAKLALHEGYHDLPLPSLAVRGAVSRVMTQEQLDLTVASIDVVLSKHLGVGGTWRFDPFVGGNVLMIIPRSEVIDATPNVDQTQMGNEADSFNSFVFKDQANIYRNRIFVGAKFQYYVFQLTLEAQFALAGSSADSRAGVTDTCTPMSQTVDCNAKDDVAAQRTLSMSAGFDF